MSRTALLRVLMPGIASILLASPPCALGAGTGSCDIVQLSSGQSHVLALRGDGTVLAWGYNGDGQLGLGSKSSTSYMPVEVPGLTAISAVAAGGSHSLALASDGSVWAWGDGNSGQLGLGGFSVHPAPVRVPSLTGIVAIAAGRTHSMVLASDGTVSTFGSNTVGECGNGQSGYGEIEPVPVTAQALSGIVAIAAGDSTSMALKNDGTTWSWGYTATATPRMLAGFADVTRIAVGGRHLMALQQNGILWTWGSNSFGELGNGTTVTDDVPGAIALTDLVDIAAGASHSLAVRADGSVWTWGSNHFGELGDGSREPSSLPRSVAGPGTATRVAAGNYTSYALTADGDVLAWGSNQLTGLGVDALLMSSESVLVPMERNRHSLAAGSTHTLAAGAGGDIAAWGSNLFGQLGTGSSSDPAAVVRVPAIADAALVAAGGEHSVAVRGDGTLWSWGNNNFGQVGNDSTLTALSPVRIASLEGVQAAALGPYHSLAIDGRGLVWSWGNNWYGQLGLGDSGYGTNRLSPAQVTIGSGVPAVAVAAGSYHSLAVLADGSLWAWGNNDYGQLGTGDLVSSDQPVELLGVAEVVSASAGFYHSLVLRRDGTVWAWGSNVEGQLGTGGPRVTSHTPTPIQGVGAISTIAGGQWHSMALGTDGRVWAWGSNAYGQLGDSGLADSPLPIEVRAVTGATAIAAGSVHSAAIVGFGRVRIWGDNSYSQLGVQSRWFVSRPMMVGPDTIPADLGNVLLAARSGSDVVFDFADASAERFRLFRDGGKHGIGQTVLGADLSAPTAVDVAALSRGGSDYYALRGLSTCSLTPGP